MTNKPSIASVTLAHNAARVLPTQLDALLRQTRPLNEIIVVNNGSSDDTFDDLTKHYRQATILNLPENVGAGGGYAAGLAYASKEQKHDWIWLLDQDSVPDNDTLENLLSGLTVQENEAGNIAILAPRLTNSETQLSYPGLMWRNGFSTPSPESLDRSLCFVDVVISSGSLIRREVVHQVGLPRADFFIDFVDFEYCFRIRRHGYKIAMVRGSHMDHAIGNPQTTKIFGYSKAWSSHVPWREYYMSRNETFTIWKYYPDWRSKLSVLRRLLRHACAILFFGKQRWACLRMMRLGFFDGRAGRLGIRFGPDGQNSSGTMSTGPVLMPKPGD